MSCCALWYFVVWTRLYRVNEVGKEDRILDEEYGDVVANNVCIYMLAGLLGP